MRVAPSAAAIRYAGAATQVVRASLAECQEVYRSKRSEVRGRSIRSRRVRSAHRKPLPARTMERPATRQTLMRRPATWRDSQRRLHGELETTLPPSRSYGDLHARHNASANLRPSQVRARPQAAQSADRPSRSAHVRRLGRNLRLHLVRSYNSTARTRCALRQGDGTS